MRPRAGLAAVAAGAAAVTWGYRRWSSGAPPQREGVIDDPADPYDLRARFCRTQAKDFSTALGEIRSGAKRSHWSWYIWPTPPYVRDGVERGSSINQYYALRDAPGSLQGEKAARAYLKFKAEGQDLRENYITMMTAVAEQLESGVDPIALTTPLDLSKLMSSVTLFEKASRGDSAGAPAADGAPEGSRPSQPRGEMCPPRPEPPTATRTGGAPQYRNESAEAAEVLGERGNRSANTIKEQPLWDPEVNKVCRRVLRALDPTIARPRRSWRDSFGIGPSQL
eukprot:TRINITY_DN5481_c0_g1_i1.p1 TRINITY_DN5481_c0_g1~~TRINITY_DN5481_c0_g1_i1.p1  ORF type:complete len:330 (+),score=76.31 TRINITY_DN5481_c0_g1_i1:149-991(+)